MNDSRERDIAAKLQYLAASKEERQKMTWMAVCTDDGCMGLNRNYAAGDFKDLREIRNRKIGNRKTRYKRNSDFYFVLSKIAERDERMKCNPLP